MRGKIAKQIRRRCELATIGAKNVDYIFRKRRDRTQGQVVLVPNCTRQVYRAFKRLYKKAVALAGANAAKALLEGARG